MALRAWRRATPIETLPASSSELEDPGRVIATQAGSSSGPGFRARRVCH